MPDHSNLIIKVTTAMMVFNYLDTLVNYSYNTNVLKLGAKELPMNNPAFTVGAGLMAFYSDEPKYLWFNSVILLAKTLRVWKDGEF